MIQLSSRVTDSTHRGHDRRRDIRSRRIAWPTNMSTETVRTGRPAEVLPRRPCIYIALLVQVAERKRKGATPYVGRFSNCREGEAEGNLMDRRGKENRISSLYVRTKNGRPVSQQPSYALDHVDQTVRESLEPGRGRKRLERDGRESSSGTRRSYTWKQFRGRYHES